MHILNTLCLFSCLKWFPPETLKWFFLVPEEKIWRHTYINKQEAVYRFLVKNKLNLRAAIDFIEEYWVEIDEGVVRLVHSFRMRSWGAIRCMCCSSWVWFCVFLCVYLFMNLYFSSRQGLSGEQSLTKPEPAGLTFCQLCVCIWRNIVMTTAWPQMEWKFEQKPLSEGSTSLEVNLKHFIILIVFKEKKRCCRPDLRDSWNTWKMFDPKEKKQTHFLRSHTCDLMFFRLVLSRVQSCCKNLWKHTPVTALHQYFCVPYLCCLENIWMVSEELWGL